MMLDARPFRLVLQRTAYRAMVASFIGQTDARLNRFRGLVGSGEGFRIG